MPDAAEDRAVNRFLSGRTLVSALLLADLVAGTAVVIARATTSTAPRTAAVRPAATTTTTTTMAVPAAARPADCGQGSAAARAVLTRAGDVYDLSARVNNETDRAIEIDRLAVRAVYPDGTKEFPVPTAGVRIETGSGQAEVSIPVPDTKSAIRPSRFEISEFRFHPAGQPECASH
jgi:hypothetical protein